VFKNNAKEKHLAQIAQTLSSSEEIVFSAYANIITQGDLGTDGGALAVTTERVVFSGSATLLGTNSSVSIRLGEINGVSSGQRMIKGGLLQPYVEMNVGGAVYLFNLRPADASDIPRAIAHAKEALAESGTSSDESSPSKGSAVDELERLAALFSGGLLSDEEFAQAKKRLLD
jgi:hypothetical protein